MLQQLVAQPGGASLPASRRASTEPRGPTFFWIGHRRVVRTIRVTRPAGGEALVDEIHEFVDMSLRRSRADYPARPEAGVLRTGEPVNLIDELTLQNARTGEILRVVGSDSSPA
jgi:hypothetical protein